MFGMKRRALEERVEKLEQDAKAEVRHRVFAALVSANCIDSDLMLDTADRKGLMEHHHEFVVRELKRCHPHLFPKGKP